MMRLPERNGVRLCLRHDVSWMITVFTTFRSLKVYTDLRDVGLDLLVTGFGPDPTLASVNDLRMFIPPTSKAFPNPLHLKFHTRLSTQEHPS